MKIKRLIVLTISLFIGLAVVGGGRVAAWDPFGPACNQAQENNRSAVCSNRSQANNPISGPGGIILKAVNLITIVTGVAAVIGIIVGGIRFTTSSGDPNGITAARNTILFAVIGLVVSLSSQAIIIFVINKL